MNFTQKRSGESKGGQLTKKMSCDVIDLALKFWKLKRANMLGCQSWVGSVVKMPNQAQMQRKDIGMSLDRKTRLTH